MAESNIPKDNRLVSTQPSMSGTNPFDNKGIQPRTSPASIGRGTNNTAPYEGKGMSSTSKKVGYNEPC